MIQYMEYGDALSVCDMALLTTYDVSFFSPRKRLAQSIGSGHFTFCPLQASIFNNGNLKKKIRAKSYSECVQSVFLSNHKIHYVNSIWRRLFHCRQVIFNDYKKSYLAQNDKTSDQSYFPKWGPSWPVLRLCCKSHPCLDNTHCNIHK